MKTKKNKSKGPFRWLKRLSNLAFFIIAACALLNSCMTFRTTDKKTRKSFEEKGLEVNVVRTIVKGVDVRYLQSGVQDTLAPLVVFVHGAPGSSDNFFKLMQDSALAATTQMISIDRPGYGYSDFGKSHTSIASQADFVKEIITRHKASKVVVVGHSFGGPIIGKLCLDNPGLIDGAVMVAPAIDPANEKIFWFSYLGKWIPFRWLAPRPLKVATDEKFTHVEELEKLKTEWGGLKVVTTVMHGDKDQVVPYANLAFAQKHFPQEMLVSCSIPGANHFIPFATPWKVKKHIQKHLSGTASE